MATAISKPTVEQLEPLALGRPGDDPFQDYYVTRLDAGLPRMLPKLAARVEPGLGREVEALLDVYRALGPDCRRDILTHPYFSYWWVKVFEAAVEGTVARLEGWLREFPRFLVVPALREDLWPAETILHAVPHERELRLAGHPRHLVLPWDAAEVELRLLDGTLAVAGDAGTLEVPVEELLAGGAALAERILLPGTEIELDGGDPWVKYLFASINAKPALENYAPRDLEIVRELDGQTVECFSAAYHLLEQTWPELVNELRAYTRVIVPYRSKVSSTFTEAAFMGAVFMSEAKQPFSSALYTAEHLLHEHSHLRLTLIQEVDPLFVGDPDRMFVSPWRKDPRPLIGIFHGAFVFARIARFLELASERLDEPLVAARRGEVVASLQDALATLCDPRNVTFTSLGEALVEELRRQAS